MQPHGLSVRVAFRRNPAGVSKGAAASFGTQPLEQRCSVLYLTARLAGKMRVSPYGHTRFNRQENRQVFVSRERAKTLFDFKSVGGYIHGMRELMNRQIYSIISGLGSLRFLGGL